MRAKEINRMKGIISNSKPEYITVTVFQIPEINDNNWRESFVHIPPVSCLF